MTRTMFGILCGAILAFMLFATAFAARADEFDEASRFTFKEAVALPGNVVLPAGSYWFVLADPDSLDTVRVLDADRTKIVATFLTTPTTRRALADNSQLTLAVRSRKEPAALLDWYYGGRLWGHEFHYSHRREARLSEDRQITLLASDE